MPAIGWIKVYSARVTYKIALRVFKHKLSSYGPVARFQLKFRVILLMLTTLLPPLPHNPSIKQPFGN